MSANREDLPDEDEIARKRKPPRETRTRRRRFVPRAATDDAGTDVANAAAFADHHGDALRYVADMQKWKMWDGKRWGEAVEGDLHRAAKETAGSFLINAARIEGDKEKRAEIGAALSLMSLSRIRAMITMAQSEPTLELRSEQLDADPFALNVANGTVNLKSGALNPHERKDYITRLVNVEYNIGAHCPRWEQFMREVFAEDEELIRFVRRAVGYSLTGDTREHALFLLWGGGCNGKSVFIEILRALLNEYGQGTPANTFIGRDRGAPTNDLAALKGARIVTVQETDDGAKFSEALVKSLTGGDAITARFLNKEFFTFVPQFKPWLATNHKPTVKGTDDGFWRRVRLIPFNVSFLGREDKQLLAALRDELSGILTWAVKGCVEWVDNGLGTAKAVNLATSTYREENDAVAQFVKDRLIEHSDADISSRRVYALYTTWAEENGEKPVKQRLLIQSLLGRPGVTAYRTGSERGLSGIGEMAER